MIEGIFIFVFGDIHPDILTHRKNNGEREFWESRDICQVDERKSLKDRKILKRTKSIGLIANKSF